jgi:16S rRNA G527 N7-methylase RsmG
MIRLLDLQDIYVHAIRLEDGVEIPGESAAAWVVSRAVSDVGEFLDLCDRFRRSKTVVVCMKGPRYRQELDEKREAANGWKLDTVLSYHLPRSGAERNLLVFRGLRTPAGRCGGHAGSN